jgi:hypothetical protein
VFGTHERMIMIITGPTSGGHAMAATVDQKRELLP